MKKYIIPGLMAIVACGGFALSSVAFSGLASSTVEAVIAIRDHIKRSVAIFEAPVNPSLPNVLIIGDSISISYILPVRKRLEGIANVIRPAANCESTLSILENLDRWLGQTKWAVIHFNAGLHDLAHVQSEGIAPGKQTMVPVENGPRWVSIDTYRSNLEKIVERLKKTGARLVFATTTPVPAGAKSRVPDDVARYNEVALAVMREQGVQIDDLYSAVVESAYQYQKPQDVHFYPEGSDILANRVASSIKARLIDSEHGARRWHPTKKIREDAGRELEIMTEVFVKRALEAWVGRDITLAATADLRALANLQVRMCWAQVERLGMLGCERYLKEIFPDGPLATPDWELTQTFDPEVVDLVEELFCTAVDLRHAREELAVRALPNWRGSAPWTTCPH